MLLSAGADTELWTATGCCGTALHLAAAIADKQVDDDNDDDGDDGDDDDDDFCGDFKISEGLRSPA